MKKNFLRYDNPLWAFLGALVFLLIFSWSTSPLYVLYGIDSPFFQIIGLGVLQGKVPYVELFDHKGPLIFFVDALGYSFGLGKLGLWMLQVVWMTFTLALLYKLASLFTDSPKRAFIATALTLIPLIDFLCEGNQCEEWMLPFETLALYFACKYVRSGAGKHSPWVSLYFGFAFAIMFYIRPNDGVMWLGGLYFGLFLLWIVNKQYRQILPNIGAFIGGVALVSAPIFAYFIKHNAVEPMIYGMIFHNLQYTSEALFTWGGIGMILIPVIIIGACLIRGRKDFRYLLIPVLVLVVIFIGKRDYYHYLIPLTPFVTLCFIMCIQRGWKAFVICVCVLFSIFSFRQDKTLVKGLANRDRYQQFYEQTDALFDNVPEEERNNIWNYNMTVYHETAHSPHLASLVGAYLHKGITPGNAAFEPFQMVFRYSAENGYGVRDNEPKWLVLQLDDEFKDDYGYIFENYDLVATTPMQPVCEVRLYRRKQQ